MNYLLILSYDGTNYCGFQVQPNGRSVAQTFQDGLEAVLGCRPDIKGCSRTDAGVHALGFALNFHADTRIPPQKLPLAINQYLPMDIRVLSARVVPEDFHARYAAHTKTYLYRIHNSPIDSPFDEKYYTRVPRHLDGERMDKAAKQFVGRHDFLALCAAGSSAAAHGDTVRTITDCGVVRKGDEVEITVTADGYLYNMVRILAGTLCEVGAGRMGPEEIPAILASRDRSKAGPTFPAKGLFLKCVNYDSPLSPPDGGQLSQRATATTAASGGNREELLGQRPAGHECRPRHEVDAGSRNPFSPWQAGQACATIENSRALR